MISSRTIVFQFLNITDAHDETKNIINAIRHLIKYKSLMRNQTKKILKKSHTTDIPSLIEEMGCILFQDGISSESITELFYFCSKLARKFETSRSENYLPLLAECLSRYLIIFIESWLMSNGGWEIFIQLSTQKSQSCECLSLLCAINCL